MPSPSMLWSTISPAPSSQARTAQGRGQGLPAAAVGLGQRAHDVPPQAGAGALPGKLPAPLEQVARPGLGNAGAAVTDG